MYKAYPIIPAATITTMIITIKTTEEEDGLVAAKANPILLFSTSNNV